MDAEMVETEGGAIDAPSGEMEAARREALARLRLAQAPTQEAETEKKKVEVKDTRSKTDLSSDLSAMLIGLATIADFLLGFIGYQFEPLSEDEAKEGARQWLPLAKRFTWIASLSLWLSAPVWIVVTVRSKLEKKKEEAAKDEPKS